MVQSKQLHIPSALAASLVVAGILLGGCGPESSAVGTVDRTFSVSGPVRLELANGSGDSRVSVGAPGEVRIHAEFRVHEWTWENADRRLKEIVNDPPFSQEASLIRIGRSGWEMSAISADYTITVPPNTEMRGACGSGNLDVNGIAGPDNFTVGSGNIMATAIAGDIHSIVGSGNATFTDVQGRIDVTAGSGNIEVRGAKDEVRARDGSGEIRIERANSNVVAETGSGSIELRDVGGDVRLHTGSGEISVDGNPAPSSYWDIRASSGDVKLHVPSTASFRFYGHSSSGDFDVAVPNTAENESSRHEYQARIGDGKARVEIETSSGDISVH